MSKNAKIWVIVIIVLVVVILGGGILAWQYLRVPKNSTLMPTSTPTTWTCGDSVTFTYKDSSVTYGTVSSQGKCWLDRNLGASQVATAYNDANAYGDLFQWGRLDDGHQTRTSGTTTILSSSDNPGHSNFIYGMGSLSDWRSPQNDNLWQGVLGINNPCPSGWRLPTSAEWDVERTSWNQQNYNGAFASPLKLTAAGFRDSPDASLHGVGSSGYYWSSTVSTLNGTDASYLFFVSDDAFTTSDGRANGFSVRCLNETTRKTEAVGKVEGKQGQTSIKYTPVAPDFSTNPKRLEFKTVITEGVKNNWPNFAGHYILIEWGCGTGCQDGVIVDANTGAIFDLPAATAGREYQHDSNELINNPPSGIRAAYGSAVPDWVYTEHYIWEDNQFKLISRWK